MPVSCHSISLTPNQVIGAVVMGEGFIAERGERRKHLRLEGGLKERNQCTY
jgi:hypothetical protein